MTHAEVKILPIIGKTLDSRDEATKLFEYLKDYCTNCGNIELDFSEVDFMSRSFADQFHKEKMEWARNSNLVILIKNAPDQIIDILQAVSKTQSDRVHKITNPAIYTYSQKESLFAFLNML